jgi:hypothetical protein
MDFIVHENNKKYNINIIRTGKKLLIDVINNFLLQSNLVIGLDFEFKNKNIALMQINLECKELDSYIFVLYPPELNKKEMHLLIKLLINPKVIKILHGGESLDIPYLINGFFKNNKDLFDQFLKNFIDTKFLCEYYHFENQINKKCNIYDLLNEFKVIDSKKIKFLERIEHNIGPIYLAHFDINNLNKNLILYAIYDVIYLPKLYNKFRKISLMYKIIIPELTQVVYFNKYFNSEYQKIKIYVDTLNNTNFNNIKLIDHYKNKYNEIMKSILDLNKINYFKSFIEIITKFILYTLLINKDNSQLHFGVSSKNIKKIIHRKNVYKLFMKSI